MRIGPLAAALGLLWQAGGLAPAAAAVISRNIAFTASVGGPVDPVQGSFSITFDNSGDIVSPTTAGFVVNTLNITPTETVGYTYVASLDRLSIGCFGSAGGCVGVNAVGTNPGVSDFRLVMDGFSSSPSVFSFRYSQNGAFYDPTSPTQVSLSVTPAAPVPAPGALLLYGTALLAFSLVGRRARPRPAARRFSPGV